MDLSAAQHQLRHHYNHQDLQSPDTMIPTPKPVAENQQQQEQKKPRPPETEPEKCPRCESTNTKFCYFNNYSLAQPRYFCKSCRRYWTKGGTLRNVPVGGVCRKNKRSSSSTASPPGFLNRARNEDMVAAAAVAASNPLFSGDNLPCFFSLASYGGGFGLGFDVMGNASVTGCEDALGHPHGGGFLSPFFENSCYGFGSMNGSSNCVSEVSEGMGVMPYDDVASTTVAMTATAVKQESDESRALSGFPWEINGDLGVAVADLEAMRKKLEWADW